MMLTPGHLPPYFDLVGAFLLGLVFLCMAVVTACLIFILTLRRTR